MKIKGINKEIELEIIQLAKKHDLNKVIVFGSRARGDYKKTSDIDLAIFGGNRAAFSVEIDEVVSTLLEFDVVDLDGMVQSELLESICSEGEVIYEKV